MRKNAIMRCFVMIVLATLWGMGCSDLNVLDESDDQYLISIDFMGGEGDGAYDFDVYSDPDCDNNATTYDPEPSLAGISALLTITSSYNAAPVQITHYQVDYIPKLSPLVAGGRAYPPDLVPTEMLEKTININSDDNATAVLETIMTIDNKLNYVSQGGLGTFAQGIYVIRVTLYGEVLDSNEDFTRVVDSVVRLMDVDNCPAPE